MPYRHKQIRLASALLIIAAAGSLNTHSGSQAARSRVAETAGIPIDVPAVGPVLVQTPCPGQVQAVQGPKDFLVVNRTSATLECRMRHPTIGGWSGFIRLGAGARLIDRRLDLDEIHVQCKPPARPFAVRVFPGHRYGLLRRNANAEVRLIETDPGQ